MTETTSPTADLLARRKVIRDHLGGADRISEQHRRGHLTVRERIDRFVDPDSFHEIGTFVRSLRVDQRPRTPGDGKVGGHAHVDGRPVTVVGDDVTVLRASGAVNGEAKVDRLYRQAVRQGNPFIYMGEGGGGRLPDILGSEGLVGAVPHNYSKRFVPKVCLVLGDSYGNPSFTSAQSDFTVQLRGTTLAIVSSRVIEAAVGEHVDPETFGRAELHESVTGQIHLAVDSEDEAFDVARDFLSYLPSNASLPPPRRDAREPMSAESISEIVPLARRRGYDMRRVIRCIVDAGEFLELREKFARSTVTALSRIDGCSVGIIASQPNFEAGTLGVDAADKIVHFLCLCDTFSIPVVILQDSPGFLVDSNAERSKLLYKAMLLQQALMGFRGLKVAIVIRKAFGLAFTALGGTHTGSDRLFAWTTAELSQMDPEVGARVLFAKELATLDEDQRRARLDELTNELTRATDPYGAAEVFGIDEIIEPSETRALLIDIVRRHRTAPPRGPSPLSTWPTCW